MDYSEVAARRRMTRSFQTTPVAPSVIDALLDQARRAPSAGNTSSIEFLVLEGPADTGRYWETTLPVERRAAFPWPRLLDAPVLIVPWVDPSAYVKRYSEPDKAGTGLGVGPHKWPVPYWFVDGGAAVMSLLLGTADLGLGALFFGLFEHEQAVAQRFGVPGGLRAVGAIAIGHALPDKQSSSAQRPRPALKELVHRGQW